jgi:streptomycin 6-kinase
MSLGASSKDLVSLRGVVDGPVPVPEGLAWWKTVPNGAEWLRGLPRLVEGCVHDWKLTLGAPFESGSVAWVAPAELPDGRRAVLKVNFPDVESEHEADALAFWAARVRCACSPMSARVGRFCLSVASPACRSGASKMRRTRLGAGAAGPLGASRAALLAFPVGRGGRALDRTRPVAAGAGSVSPGRSRREHAAAGGRWLVIDPKPLIGERAFDLASSLRDRRGTVLPYPTPHGDVAWRLYQSVGYGWR